jgi:hypothetical protein
VPLQGPLHAANLYSCNLWLSGRALDPVSRNLEVPRQHDTHVLLPSDYTPNTHTHTHTHTPNTQTHTHTFSNIFVQQIFATINNSLTNSNTTNCHPVLWRLQLIGIIHNESFGTSQRKQCASITNTSQLISYSEITAGVFLNESYKLHSLLCHSRRYINWPQGSTVSCTTNYTMHTKECGGTEPATSNVLRLNTGCCVAYRTLLQTLNQPCRWRTFPSQTLPFHPKVSIRTGNLIFTGQQGLHLTTHVHLVPNLRTSTATPPIRHTPSRVHGNNIRCTNRHTGSVRNRQSSYRQICDRASGRHWQRRWWMFGAEELRRGCVTDRHSGITVEGEVSGSCCTRYGLPLLLCSGSETVRTAS